MGDVRARNFYLTIYLFGYILLHKTYARVNFKGPGYFVHNNSSVRVILDCNLNIFVALEYTHAHTYVIFKLYSSYRERILFVSRAYYIRHHNSSHKMSVSRAEIFVPAINR